MRIKKIKKFFLSVWGNFLLLLVCSGSFIMNFIFEFCQGPWIHQELKKAGGKDFFRENDQYKGGKGRCPVLTSSQVRSPREPCKEPDKYAIMEYERCRI